MEPCDLFRSLASFADPDLWILNGPEFREWKPAKADTIQHHKPLIISEIRAICGSIRLFYPWGWELLSPEPGTRNPELETKLRPHRRTFQAAREVVRLHIAAIGLVFGRCFHVRG